MKSLRRQLFGSHVLVMVVALGVMLFGVVIAVTVIRTFGDVNFDRVNNDFGKSRSDQPPGFLVLIVPMAAAAAAAALVSWRIARRLAAPIEAARLASRKLASGRYDVQVDGGSVTELAELANDINQLGDELRATEQRRLRLVGDVAHELRNPLATIEASMEALMDGVLPATDETYARIALEASRLRRLARDLSELSATAEPSAVVSQERVDLGAVVTHVVEQISPQAAAKRLELQWAPVPNLEVLGDRDRLIQIFTNIIGNAVQYTTSGHVAVGAGGGDGATVTVTVADTGSGLSNEDLGLVFERFHRVDGATEGTGVGLAIAKSLIESHGGTIEAASPGLGQGSTFTVHLPRHS